MKIIFAGTPEFAVPALAALLAAGHQVSLVLTQPDRPSGRGMRSKASPVKLLALQHDIAVFQPETLKADAAQARIESEQADVMVVAAYGLIIPDAILAMPRYGCFNIHASLLPRWRGAAPIQRALLAEDAKTGITIMEVVAKLDAGAMVVQSVLPITKDDTAQTLHNNLATQGAKLIIQVMADLARGGKVQTKSQDEALVTYAHKLNKLEATINWKLSATELCRQVRAFNPFPVAQTTLHGKACRIWMAHSLEGQAKAGMITSLADGIVVGCGEGLLDIKELQMPGGKRLSASAFLAGHALQVGEYFGS